MQESDLTVSLVASEENRLKTNNPDREDDADNG
jgi:hypothetical protein